MFLCALSPPLSAQELTARITYVFTGDEVAADTGEEELRLVLWGIETPPLDTLYGRHAREYIATLFESSVLEVTLLEQIGHGRYRARVAPPDGPSLSHQLVAAGLAWHDPNEAPEADILALFQTTAKEQSIGVWGDPELQPSWAYSEASR